MLFQSQIRCASLIPTDVLAGESTGPAADLRSDEAIRQLDDPLAGHCIEVQ